jgi:PD-(D/E)XK endonuclease
VLFNTWSTDHGQGRQDYVGRADIVAVHVRDPDNVFMVPVEACSRYSGSLRLEPARNNQQKKSRPAADYTFERWVERLGLSPGALPRGGLLAQNAADP